MEFYDMLNYLRGKMGEATAHFLCGVATLQWCRDSRGRSVHDRHACVHDRGPAPTIEGVHARGVPGKAYRDKPPWALCHDREFPVATEKANLVSR